MVADKPSCNICDQILEGLEKIDDECDVFGIHLVKIQDPQLAKRYSIKTFPALVYFRNGNPLLFEGYHRTNVHSDFNKHNNNQMYKLTLPLYSVDSIRLNIGEFCNVKKKA